MKSKGELRLKKNGDFRSSDVTNSNVDIRRGLACDNPGQNPNGVTTRRGRLIELTISVESKEQRQPG